MRNSLKFNVFLFLALLFIIKINTGQNALKQQNEIRQKTEVSSDYFKQLQSFYIHVETGIAVYTHSYTSGSTLKQNTQPTTFNVLLIELSIFNFISNYLSQSLTIEVGLSISDIIFPFHFFW